MKKILFIIICCMASFLVMEIKAQVKIGYNSQKLLTPNLTLLALSIDTSMAKKDTAGKTLVLPSAKGTQVTATNGQIPEGLLIYNVDSAMLQIYTKYGASATSGNGKQGNWKLVSYQGNGKGNSHFVKIKKTDLTTTNFPKLDGSLDTVVIAYKKNSTAVNPSVRKKNNNNNSNDGGDGTMPRTRISYNGITLKPGTDYKVELINGTSGSPKSVKIKFQTLVPEIWGEFDEFFIEYES